MTRKVTGAAAVVFVLAGCGAGVEGGSSDPIVAPVGDEAVVTWIDDGDTIEVEYDDGSTATIRLIATNSPDQGECHADVALDHLIDTLKDETVTIEDFGEDQFDRTLAHVFVGERHINLEMVEIGLSLASTPEEEDPYGPAILDAEDTAYNDGIGLWASDACGNDQIPDVEFDTGASVIDPPGPDEDVLDTEEIVVRNAGNDPFDMEGWILRDESTRHRFTFDGQSTLQSGDSVVITSADPGWDPGGGSVWNNGGDMALLQLPDGTVVARWRY